MQQPDFLQTQLELQGPQGEAPHQVQCSKTMLLYLAPTAQELGRIWAAPG